MNSIQELYDLLNNLLYTTVRIHTLGDDGVGTCFFYHEYYQSGNYIPYLITNKHVVEDCDEAEILFHIGPTDMDGKPTDIFEFIIYDLKERCKYHSNPDIDLCAIPLLQILDEVKVKTGFNIFYKAFPSQNRPSEDWLKARLTIEDVYMIGYPTGLWDEENNFPLVRKGITASHPAYDFNLTSRGAIDIATFQGSSGSPVFLYKMFDLNPDGTIPLGTVIFTLLGVLESMGTVDVEGKIVNKKIPTKNTKLSVQVGIHLGYYVKARELSHVDQFLDYKDYIRVIYNV